MPRTAPLAAAVLACLAAAPSSPAPPPEPAPPAGKAPGIDLAAMDPKADPCDDFYAYACGGWLAHTEIPADRGRWGRFNELEEKNKERLKGLLEELAAGKGDLGEARLRKAGVYYQSCMDEAGVEARGTASLAAAWSRLEPVKDPSSLAAAVGRLHAEGVAPLFFFRAEQDLKNSSEVVAGISQGGLSLPDRDYYTRSDPKSVAIQKALVAHVARMLELAGVERARAEKEAGAVYDLERSLAEPQWTRVELRDPRNLDHRLDLSSLEKLAPRFPWRPYLEAVGAPGVRAFLATTPKALARIDELAASTPAETWRAYLRWKVLERAADGRALPRAFVDERFAFTSQNFTGAKELEPRWKFCVAATDRALGEALGEAFVRRYFAGDAKEKALALVTGVQAAQARNLAEVAWMDPATRGKALEKLERIDNKIGYPSRWRDYESLRLERDAYLENAVAASAFEMRRQVAKIGKPLDRSEWGMTPPTVNAYYDGQLNEMVFPAGILQPPFYTRGAADAVNYGATGFVVGHELTHGFDDEGRKFDASGNLADWWTAPVAAEFERRAACLDRQFSGYPAVEELKVNGRLTLGENIADLGGLKLALSAYRASRKGKPPEASADGLTPEQQFFVAAGQLWCGKVRPELARVRAQTDPHSPPRWRVNGPLSNLKEFAAAFACKADSPMVRSERCEVW